MITTSIIFVASCLIRIEDDGRETKVEDCHREECVNSVDYVNPARPVSIAEYIILPCAEHLKGPTTSSSYKQVEELICDL